jgi:hypothetical protein
MDQKQLIARLRQLDDACDRIGSNLLDLDRHPAVALLKVSHLAGETAERWAAANETLAGLFVAHGALRALIDDANRQHSRAWFMPRLDELAAMLDGQSIVVSDESARLGDRDLLSASRVVVRRSPDQLIADMSARYEQVRDVVMSVAAVWDEMIPRLREERRRVVELGRAAAALAVDADGLARVTEELRNLSDRVLSDPLALDRTQIDSIATVIDGFDRELSALRQLVDHWPEQVARARGLLDEARAAVGEYDELAARTKTRIATAHGFVRVVLPPDLEDSLTRIAADHDVPVDGRVDLIEWCRTVEASLVAARHGSDRCRSLLAERAELRGLLDAYVAKASQLGLLEDPAVSEALEHARLALYVAPTDLELARQRIEQYQRLLSARSLR